MQKRGSLAGSISKQSVLTMPRSQARKRYARTDVRGYHKRIRRETMNRYQLQAKLNGHIKTVWFEDINDTEAIYTGIFKTLDKASKSRVWQKGYIALTNLTTGELVKEMASKQ